MDAESSKRIKLDSLLHDGRLNLNLHSLSLKDLREVTNDFSDENLLGQGGFGTVYKGLLQNGNIIAVKKLASTMPGLQDKQYENEVRNLMRLIHPNIVQLVGYCSETEKDLVLHNGKYVYAEKSERLLCLEYMPKGSLRNYISDASSGLDWNTRYKIIVGICYGLHYLHEEWQPSTPIIHRDLKPANILLDENMMPKIADFGLSRLFGEEQTRTTTKNFGGTLGYMAPEYLNRGIITKELDIFSLGVLIIHVVTGQKHYPYKEDETSSQKFIELVLKEWRNSRLEKVPGYTSKEFDCQQIRQCVEIGLLCVRFDRAERPTTRRIIEMLGKDAECSNEREPNMSPGSNAGSKQQSPGSSDDKSHHQKGVYEHNFAVPVHLPNFAMMPTAQTAGNQSDKKLSEHHHQQQQQPQVSRGQGVRIDLASSQPFVMPFGSISPPGSAPTGLDFSALAQNHAVFQSHQEAARHGYPQLNFAAAQSVQATQNKPHQITGEPKSVAGNSSSTPVAGASKRKKSASRKYMGDSQQHSLSFTRRESKSYVPPFLSGSTNEGSSRTLSLIGAESPDTFGIVSKSTSSSTPASTQAAASSTIFQQQQQHQHFLQMHQKNQQLNRQQHHLNAPSTPNNAGGYPDRLNIASFENMMYPEKATPFAKKARATQGGVQSPQLKASPGRGTPSSAAPPSNLIVMKNIGLHQQQAKVPMQALSTPGHHEG